MEMIVVIIINVSLPSNIQVEVIGKVFLQFNAADACMPAQVI